MMIWKIVVDSEASIIYIYIERERERERERDNPYSVKVEKQ